MKGEADTRDGMREGDRLSRKEEKDVYSNDFKGKVIFSQVTQDTARRRVFSSSSPS